MIQRASADAWPGVRPGGAGIPTREIRFGVIQRGLLGTAEFAVRAASLAEVACTVTPDTILAWH